MGSEVKFVVVLNKQEDEVLRETAAAILLVAAAEAAWVNMAAEGIKLLLLGSVGKMGFGTFVGRTR